MPGVQRTHAPNSICFGCGPANEKGLRIDSDWDDDEFVCEWDAAEHHQAFPGVLNGGIIGTLMDCHGNWCAATTLMKKRGEDVPPVTVTAFFDVKLKRPTPAKAHLKLVARPTRVDGDRVEVDTELFAEGKVCATSHGVFVAVTEGHPAYHRWG